MPIISPKIPTGLEELMRGLAKSVIKENPQNIYEFAAEYFENLLRERDGSVDQSYKKFATYKVYKKNKSARLKREKENSHDVNDVNSDNGCKRDESTASFEKRQKRGEKSSVEEFILPAAAQPLQALVKAQTSVSSESEFHASIKKESSVDIEGAPSPSGKSQDEDDDDIANMVLDSDMEEAALKIQSTFRGHKTRKEVKSKLAFGEEEINEQVEVKEDDVEIKAISESEREREDNEIVEVLQSNEAEASEGSVNENQIENNESIDKPEAIPSEVDDDDVANMVLDEEMEQAALKIQSTFRGHKTRVEMKKELSQSGGEQNAACEGSQEGQEGAPPTADDDDDVANMVLDEEMEMAALKIQSSFRGHKVRQEMKDNLAVTSTENVDEAELNEDQQEEMAQDNEVVSQEVLEEQKLSNEEIIEDEIKPETVSETMASTEKENSEVEAITIVDGEPLEECEEIPNEEILSEAPADDDLLDTTPVDGAEVEELKEAEEESNGNENEENMSMAEVEALEEKAPEICEEMLEKLASLEVLTTNPENDSEEAELVKEIEAALNSKEHSVENATGSLSEVADVTIEAEVDDAKSLAPQAGEEQEDENREKVEVEELAPQASLKLDDESPVVNDEALEETNQTIVEEEQTADVADGDEIIEQSSVEKSLNEVVQQDDEKSAENLSDDKATGDLQVEHEKVLEEPEEIKQSVDADDQPSLEGEGGESAVAVEDENKLQKDLSIVAEAIETSPSQEATENQLESEDVIELTEKSEIDIDERVEEKVAKSQDDVTAPGENSEINEQEPQSTLNELPTEIETVGEAVVDDSDYIDSTPVKEEVCEKKFIGDLVDDQVVESENLEKGSLGGSDQENKGEESHEIIESLVKVPSGEIEYLPLRESLSEHDLTPAESLDEVDDKSRDLTDEKSLDGDSKSSKQPSVDENCAEIQSAATEKSIESLICSSTVDDAETNATQEAEKVVENLNEAKAVDSILNAEISPIELMDEVINERAGAVANELFNVIEHHLDDESELEKSPEENQSTEIIEPKLGEENPLKEIEPSKSINLSQESVQQLQDEQNPINDEILQPDIDDSEIPEETQVPVDGNIPTVSLEAENPSVSDVEQLPGDSAKDSDREPQKNDDDDDDIANMVLDEEMEDAALKIQAAFRGHKVRKDVPPPTSSVQEVETEENGAENPETTVVIDQCTDEGQTDDQQEEAETEAQDTSIDVEEIQESEEQEQATEETHDEANTEEETAVDSAENETAEQTEDDPEGTPEGGEASEQPPQNDDDDDVANMVLDEEMAQAALKIQSTFRGHKSRANMKKDGAEGGEASTTPAEPPKDSVQEVDDDVAKLTLDDKEEEKKEEEGEAAQSSSEEKTAKQLQDEEDIANIVMDAEMEQTALKIQSAFRGKLGRKKPKEGSETTEYETETEDETPAKSEEDPFQPNDMSQEHETSGEKFDDEERASDYSGAAAHYSQSDEARYSIDRYDGSIEYEPLVGNTSTDDMLLMQGGGIFPEASGESSDTLLSSKKNSAEMMTGSSGEDRDPDRHSSYEKVPSDKSFEIDETISQRKSVDQLNDEQVIIENFDFDANKDTAEAMYYALKKNEMETQRQLSDKQPSVEGGERTEGEQRLSLETTENQSMDYEQQPESDDDDDCVVIAANSAKRLKYGMSMDDRLLGSILSQDYTTKARREVFPDDGFDPLLEASMRNQHFLEKLHEMSNSDEGKEMPYDDYPGEDEDHFDDFYRSNNIRQKIMASSVSIADSDYFDPTNNKSSIIDENIRTALETIHSTDSESTTITKIQAGERLGGKRANNITTQSMQYASFGNAAIDKSLDEFIQSQELLIDRFDEEAEGLSSPPPRMQESIDDWTDDTTTYTDSDKKIVGAGGVIGIKLEQKPSFLTVDERRRTLHREDAIQRNSTREDEDSSKSSNVSGEKLLDKENVIPVASVAPQSSVIDGDVEIAVPDLTAKSQVSSQSIVKPHRMKRQHTMPVQIQTDVIRVIPKHLRKRIKSAESTDKKKRAPK